MRQHVYWIFLAYVFLVGGVAGAAFAPANSAALKTAVGSCLSESGSGTCPIFSASKDASGNSYNVMGEWDVSKVTSLSLLFENNQQFNAHISKWQTGLVSDMHGSTSNPSSNNRVLCFCFCFFSPK